MIVHPLPSPDGDRLLVTNQIDHAAFSAELLSLWRADGLPEHPRRHQLIRGTRQHDNGWAEVDSAPRVQREGDEAGRVHGGRPHDFRSTPADVRLELWQTGVQRKADDDPEAWVYVVRHARALHDGEGGTETEIQRAWRQALDDWRDLEVELRERIGLAEDDLASDYRWLALCDLISLAVCLRWSRKQGLGTTMRVETEDDLAVTLHLDPFPLAGTTTFHVPCRIVPDHTYTGDADLAMELATARWRKMRVRVAP